MTPATHGSLRRLRFWMAQPFTAGDNLRCLEYGLPPSVSLRASLARFSALYPTSIVPQTFRMSVAFHRSLRNSVFWALQRVTATIPVVLVAASTSLWVTSAHYQFHG